MVASPRSAKGPTHMLPMHNAKQSSSVPVAGTGRDRDPSAPHAPSTASPHES